MSRHGQRRQQSMNAWSLPVDHSPLPLGHRQAGSPDNRTRQPGNSTIVRHDSSFVGSYRRRRHTDGS